MAYPIQVSFRNLPDAVDGSRILARFMFGEAVPVCPDMPTVHSGLNPISEVPPFCEDWISDMPVSRGEAGNVAYAHDKRLLIGRVALDLNLPTDETYSKAYQEVLSTTRQSGFPFLLRTWHYFPDVNRIENGVSRYELFCCGRNQALAETMGGKQPDDAAAAQCCAASVIGIRSSEHNMFFLAACDAGMPVENTDQTAPWKYPQIRSEARPLFARAIWHPASSAMFISGTASIVGSKSMYVGDTSAQLRRIFENLNRLFEARGVGTGAERHFNYLKIYLRHAEAVKSLRADIEICLKERNMSSDAVVFFEGEVCRPELDVEIEALAYL